MRERERERERETRTQRDKERERRERERERRGEKRTERRYFEWKWRGGLDMKRNVVVCFLSMLLADGMEQASIDTVTSSCTGTHLHHACVYVHTGTSCCV